MDLSSNARKATGVGVATPNNDTRGADIVERDDDEPSTVADHSLWARVYVLLVNVRNRFVGSSFPVFKRTQMSDASTQTDPPPDQTVATHCHTASVKTDPANDPNALPLTYNSLTDPPASCESAAVQTDAVVCHTVACQTTDSASRDEQRTPAVQDETVGVQTDGPARATVRVSKKNSNKAVVDELTAKFGNGDHKPAAVSNKRVNLKAVLRKIELKGFKSLSFQEMSFTHQKLIENSVALCKKYKSLIEIAVKHLPSWQRGSTAQKLDLVHIFATLDEVLDLKNKEIDTHKIDLASEIGKRMDVEKKYAEKDRLLSDIKMIFDGLAKKNKTSLRKPDEGGHSKRDRNGTIDKCIQQCSSSRYSYNEVIAGKFIKCPENKAMIDEKVISAIY